MREMKKRKKPSGTGATVCAPWELLGHMDFLREFVKHRRYVGSMMLDVLPGLGSPVPYMFVGNAAFPLKMYMLRPYPGKFLTEGKRIFNYRLSRASRVIENTFGIMASKFRIFRCPIIANPEKVTKVTKATCCLHNYQKQAAHHLNATTVHQGIWIMRLRMGILYQEIGSHNLQTESRTFDEWEATLSPVLLLNSGRP